MRPCCTWSEESGEYRGWIRRLFVIIIVRLKDGEL